MQELPRRRRHFLGPLVPQGVLALHQRMADRGQMRGQGRGQRLEILLVSLVGRAAPGDQEGRLLLVFGVVQAIEVATGERGRRRHDLAAIQRRERADQTAARHPGDVDPRGIDLVLLADTAEQVVEVHQIRIVQVVLRRRIVPIGLEHRLARRVALGFRYHQNELLGFQQLGELRLVQDALGVAAHAVVQEHDRHRIGRRRARGRQHDLERSLALGAGHGVGPRADGRALADVRVELGHVAFARGLANRLGLLAPLHRLERAAGERRRERGHIAVDRAAERAVGIELARELELQFDISPGGRGLGRQHDLRHQQQERAIGRDRHVLAQEDDFGDRAVGRDQRAHLERLDRAARRQVAAHDQVGLEIQLQIECFGPDAEVVVLGARLWRV